MLEGLPVGPELCSGPAGKSHVVLSAIWGSFSRGSVSAELWHQAFALVCCEAGLCSVFLSQTSISMTAASLSPCGQASFTVWDIAFHLWNTTLVPSMGPCGLSNSFLFLLSVWCLGCSSLLQILGTTQLCTEGRTGHMCPLHVRPGNGCPHAHPPSAFPFLWARTQLPFHRLGLCRHLEPHPLTHTQASCRLICSLTPRTRALALSGMEVASDWFLMLSYFLLFSAVE